MMEMKFTTMRVYHHVEELTQLLLSKTDENDPITKKELRRLVDILKQVFAELSEDLGNVNRELIYLRRKC